MYFIFFTSAHAISYAVWYSLIFSIIFFARSFVFIKFWYKVSCFFLALAKAIRVDCFDAFSSRASSSGKASTKLLLVVIFNPSKSFVNEASTKLNLLVIILCEWSERLFCGCFCCCCCWSDSRNDVPPEAQRYITIAVLQGAVRPSSSSSIVADIKGFFLLDYTTLVAGQQHKVSFKTALLRATASGTLRYHAAGSPRGIATLAPRWGDPVRLP